MLNTKKKLKKKEMRRHDSEEVVKKKKKRRHNDDNVEVFQNEEVKKKKKKRKNSDNVFQLESQQVKKKKKKPETFEQCDIESQKVKKKKKKKKKKKNHFEQDKVLEIVELEHKHENNNRENEEGKEEKLQEVTKKKKKHRKVEKSDIDDTVNNENQVKSQTKKKKKKEKVPENSEHENIELQEIKKKKKKKKKVEHSDIYYVDNAGEQIKAKKEKKKKKKKKKKKLENVDFDNSEASTSEKPVGVESTTKGFRDKLSTDGNDEIIILSKDEVKVERNQKKKKKRRHSEDDQSNVDADVQSKRHKKKIEKLKENLSTTIENHLRNDSQSKSEISSMLNTEENTEIKYLVDIEDELNVSKIFNKHSPLTTEHKKRTFKKTNKKINSSIVIASDSEFASPIIDSDDESSSQIILNSHSEIDSEDTNVLKNSKSISTKLKHQGRSINNANRSISNGESELQADITSIIKESSSPNIKISQSKRESKVETFKVNDKATRKQSGDDIVNLSRFSKSYNMKTLVKHPLLLDWQVTYKQLSEAGVECHSGNWTTDECAILKESIKSFQNENLCKDFLNYLNNVRDSKEWKDFKGENIFIRLGENINRPIRYIKYKVDMWYPKDAPLKSNRFSEDEVKQLLLLHKKYDNNWKAIGDEMGRSREGVRCKFAAIKLKSEQIITDVDKDRSETHNKFTSKEDDWIRKWVKMSLEKNKSTVKDDIRKVNWELAASKLKNRSAMACRQRWKLYLRTDITEQKKEPFQRRKLLAKKINITKHLIDSGINDSRDIDWKQLTLLLRCDEDPSLLHKRYINWLAVNKDLMRGDGFSEKLKHLYGHLQERVGQDTTLLD